MRPPKRAYTTTAGPVAPELDTGRYVEFNDPEAKRYTLPTYPYHSAPKELATKRQLRKQGLSPRGEIQAQIVWWHGGTRYRNGRLGRIRRTAYLYKIADAVPVRPMTPAMWHRHAAMMAARMTCPTCNNIKPYCISRSLGECNDCHDRARSAA
jgi:hypothetical protein